MEVSYVCQICNERITFETMKNKYIDYYMHGVCFYCGKEVPEILKYDVSDIMKDFDTSKYDGVFCKKVNCHTCEGTDENGEPNGYGCADDEEYRNKRYKSILKRRINKLIKISED